MLNIADVEKTIQTMRAQAAQLEATANMLEACIQPWRQTQDMIEQGQKALNQFWNMWGPK